MTEPILEVKNLCFSYDEGQEILKNINTVILTGQGITNISKSDIAEIKKIIENIFHMCYNCAKWW